MTLSNYSWMMTLFPWEDSRSFASMWGATCAGYKFAGPQCTLFGVTGISVVLHKHTGICILYKSLAIEVAVPEFWCLNLTVEQDIVARFKENSYMWRQNLFFFFLASIPSSISCFIIAIGELCTCVAPSLDVSLFKFAISLFHFHKKSPLSFLGVRSSRTAGIYFSSFMYMFFHGFFLVELSNAWLGVHTSLLTWCWFPFILLIRAHFRREKIISDFIPLLIPFSESFYLNITFFVSNVIGLWNTRR